MKVEVRYQPSYSLAMVTLDAGEAIQTESGAMVGMSPDLEMETAASGGFLKSLSRSMFGGESFFLNTYTAKKAGDSVALAPPLPGDIAVIELQDEELLVQSGSYLASSKGVNVDTKWSGAKTFFGSEGLIMLRVSGTGTLIISSYGAIHAMELAAGQSYVIDTGHLVTFQEHMNYRVKKVAGWKSTLFSGEGLVAELTGPGKLTLQTRSQDSFLAWLLPKIPKQTTYVSSGNK
ncbi:MAG: TIGR00266 family protein [Ardenticatenaceae bacterium]|nr:TIGR00266 family protein [Ardenticatenaceae bacterium]